MKYRVLILCTAIAFGATGCSLFVETPGGTAPSPEAGNAATMRCADDGGTVVRKSAAGGGAYDVCRFSDGSECEAWAYYHSLCKPGQAAVAKEPQKTAPVPAAETKPASAAPTPSPSPSPVPSSSPISITAPAPDEQIASPAVITGTAAVPDGKITVAFTNLAGTIIFSVPVSVRDGAFKGTVGYEFSSTKEGFIEVFGDSRDSGAKVRVKF